MNIVESKGYAPEFDICVSYGDEGVAMLRRVLGGTMEGTTEVKRDSHIARERGTMYVEYAQNPHRLNLWRYSGIYGDESRADWFFYWVTDDLGICVGVEALKKAIGICVERGVLVAEDDGDNPTKGYSIPIDALIVVLRELGLAA